MNKADLLTIAKLASLVITILQPIVRAQIDHVMENPSLVGNFWCGVKTHGVLSVVVK
jgi:hypothetical protein